VRRLVYGLRPPALDELGLVGALRQGPLDVDVRAPEPMPPLPAAVEVAAFRIAQEALTNAARHAGARSATVVIEVASDLAVEIRDDGRGLAPGHRAGVGLTSMRERATELGGSLEVTGGPSGGVVVRAVLPLG
jgi:two-component system, NarL family, sensor kinase